MKTRHLITIFLIVASCFVLEAQDKQLTKNEKIGIDNLKENVTYKRKEAVAKQIKYPLIRCGYFKYAITSQKDFVNSFDIIFDTKQIQEFRTAQWEYIFFPSFECYSLQGDGYVGEFNIDGKLILSGIPLSESEMGYIQSLIEKEKMTLHPSIRNYKEPKYLIYAGKYRIRIDRMPDDTLRYCSWNKDAAISAEPDLVIYGGEECCTQWGNSIIFNNGEYEYTLEDFGLSEGAIFSVSKNGTEILVIEEGISISHYYI